MKSRRYGAAFAILAALLLILLAMNLCIGSVNIPLSEILHILMKNSGSDTYTDIVMNIRFPRALAAAVLGGGLALAGYLLQTFFHNPIAGPFTLGISSGANLAKLVSVGPALLLQEFGNLGTILLSMPLALLLGLKKESIGACYSINRDSNLGLTTDIFGPDAPETKGTFAVYIVGSVIGTVFISILASVVASWNIFDPIALGMASGVGSGSMMTAAAGTLGEIYPQQAENIMIMGGASDMLTGITGIYMGTFVGLPLAKKLYAILEPKIGRKNNQEVK